VKRDIKYLAKPVDTMTILDLTNKSQVPYPFAQIETTAEDISMCKRILKNVSKHLSEFISLKMRPNSVSFINKSRKSLRIIFYNVDKLISDNNLFVVIFFASKRKNITETENRDFFETDWNIAMSLLGNPTILCYASQELKDGNWFNIVLFTKESDKDHVLAKTYIHMQHIL
jgi:hypothetical protein